MGDLVLTVLTNGQGQEDPREKARVEVPLLDIFARCLKKGTEETDGAPAGAATSAESAWGEVISLVTTYLCVLLILFGIGLVDKVIRGVRTIARPRGICEAVRCIADDGDVRHQSTGPLVEDVKADVTAKALVGAVSCEHIREDRWASSSSALGGRDPNCRSDSRNVRLNCLVFCISRRVYGAIPFWGTVGEVVGAMWV